MIRTLSPYNYITPLVSPASGLTCTSYTLNLYIWNGNKANVPATTTESWTKLNPTASTGNDTINISRVLADYIEVPTVTGTGVQFVNANARWWIKTEVRYITNTTENPQFGLTQLFGRGYSYGNEGENITTITDNMLLDGREFKVSRQGVAIIPIYSPGNTAPAISVVSQPDNQINFNPITPPSLEQNNSNEATQYLWIDTSLASSDKTITIDVTVGLEEKQIVLLVEDEFKHDPKDIVFLNKYGVLQTLTFFKEFVKNINITREGYESDNGQPSTGAHQFRTLNVQGREGFKVQSGWVDESMNDTFKQMLLSDKVWHLDNGTYVPLNIQSEQLSYKTQKIDRLIQYEIEFLYSFNVKNNI